VTTIGIRPGRPDEAAMLSDLALRSKAFWGYDEQFLEACRTALTVRPGDVSTRRVMVAEASGRVVGFYNLDGTPPEGALGNLWIEPTYVRNGIGRCLWDHAMASARATGFASVLIDADPFAEGFYLAMGAERIGEVASDALPGRMLPQLRVLLPA
jgi:ribosomal protein S18 acetylase RimI-like enzyme